jgi:hypothetical protein
LHDASRFVPPSDALGSEPRLARSENGGAFPVAERDRGRDNAAMSARFAVLQKDLNPPSREALARACARVPGLTAADAGMIHQDAFGILLKDFPQAGALAFHEALLEEGVDTEVVEQRALPVLPMGRTVPRLDAEAAGLRVHDALGRATLVPWEELMLVAAGNVLLSEFVRRPVPGMAQRLESFMGPESMPVTDYVRDEERSFHLCLEIITMRSARRFTAQADRLNYMYLGARLADRAAKNFPLLMQDILRFAPQAAVNSGAFNLRERAPRLFEYPSKGAFLEEITWLLWRMKQEGWAVGGAT